MARIERMTAKAMALFQQQQRLIDEIAIPDRLVVRQPMFGIAGELEGVLEQDTGRQIFGLERQGHEREVNITGLQFGKKRGCLFFAQIEP